MGVFRTLLLASSFALVAGAAFASDADFKLANKTGHTIDEVYVSPHSSDNWGKDFMGDNTLDDGEIIAVNFPHGGGRCNYDIKVKYHSGSSAEWDGVNLCEYNKISLFVEGSHTHAVGE